MKVRIGVLLAIMLLAAACGGQATTEEADAPAATDAPEQASFDGQTLRVGIFSQQSADFLMEGFGNQFEEDTGAKIEWVVAATDVNVSKILADPENPEVDTMIVSNHDVWPLQDAGIVVEPDYSAMSNFSNIVPGADLPTGPGLWYFDHGICYNTEKFEEAGIEAPESIEDLFDPRLAGRVGLPDSTSGFFNTMTTPLAEHFGFPLDDPGPLVEKFAQIEDPKFFNSNTDATNLWQSGDVWVGIFSGRCRIWKNDGLPFELAPLGLEIGGQTYPLYGYVLAISNVKNGNPELGEVFMDYAISEDGVGPFLRAVGGAFTPTVISVRESLLSNPDFEPVVNKNPSEDIYLPDYATFWQNKADWVNAWNREIQQ